jgi:hypothetical protein
MLVIETVHVAHGCYGPLCWYAKIYPSLDRIYGPGADYTPIFSSGGQNFATEQAAFNAAYEFAQKHYPDELVQTAPVKLMAVRAPEKILVSTWNTEKDYLGEILSVLREIRDKL